MKSREVSQGARANSGCHGESYSLLEVGRATRMLVRMGMRLRRRRKRPKPACRSNLPISAAVLGSPRPMASVESIIGVQRFGAPDARHRLRDEERAIGRQRSAHGPQK